MGRWKGDVHLLKYVFLLVPDYLQFLKLGTSPGIQRVFLPQEDDGVSVAISISGEGFPFGNSIQKNVYVRALSSLIPMQAFLEMRLSLTRTFVITSHWNSLLCSQCRFLLMATYPLVKASMITPQFCFRTNIHFLWLHSGQTLQCAVVLEQSHMRCTPPEMGRMPHNSWV